MSKRNVPAMISSAQCAPFTGELHRCLHKLQKGSIKCNRSARLNNSIRFHNSPYLYLKDDAIFSFVNYI